MIDPISIKIGLAIASYLFLKDNLKESSKNLEIQKNELDRFKENELLDLKRRINDKTFKQKMQLLHEAKNSYVEKSNSFYMLKKEFEERYQLMYAQIDDVYRMKRELYLNKRHDEIKFFKDKGDDLKGKLEEVKLMLKDYSIKVRQFNQIVAEIKKVIADVKAN